MGTQIGVTFAVLGLWAVLRTIVQDRPEFVVAVSADIRMSVEDDAGNLLAHALAHEARLPRLDAEPLLLGDAADRHLKTPGAPLQNLVSGEGQVVGIARIAGADGPGQADEPAVE